MCVEKEVSVIGRSSSVRQYLTQEMLAYRFYSIFLYGTGELLCAGREVSPSCQNNLLSSMLTATRTATIVPSHIRKRNTFRMMDESKPRKAPPTTDIATNP